jgi:branched-chain amino acid transport system substrate-binding protein
MRPAGLGLALLALAGPAAAASLPVLVPLTGFLALEGTSQRNGALLALESAPPELGLVAEVVDTGTAPEGAVTALERVLERADVVAVAASMLGVQMLAMIPRAEEAGVPLVTVSGTAAITEQGSRQVFRFFPNDAVTKRAQARYVTEERGFKRPALITQTTAYGQSGRQHLRRLLPGLGAEVVFDEAVDPSVKDYLPVLTRAQAAQPDVLVLHLHSAPSALLLRQAAGMGIRLPVVAGSALHQPSTAALLEPAELKGVCAETAASPVSGGSPEMERFTAAYRARFQAEPDAFALGQYDGVRMVLDALGHGGRSAAEVRAALAGRHYRGLAMDYHSDGAGNMAHSAQIICYDGESRIPRITKRYDLPDPR